MSVREELERRVREAIGPRDPAWLVYADWLTEHDDPRGEWIVMLHERLRTGVNVSKEFEWLSTAARRVDAWVAERSPKFTRIDDCIRTYGFPTTLVLRQWMSGDASIAEWLLSDDCRLVSAMLVPEEQTQGRAGWPMHRILVLPRIDQLKNLGIVGRRKTDSSTYLISCCPRLSNLTTLRLDRNQITSAGAFNLSRSPNLRSLRCLSLVDNPVDFDGVEELINSKELRGLTRLEVSASPELKRRLEGVGRDGLEIVVWDRIEDMRVRFDAPPRLDR
jgi:uncharacterized protein (TIGR02996 family)